MFAYEFFSFYGHICCKGTPFFRQFVYYLDDCSSFYLKFILFSSLKVSGRFCEQPPGNKVVLAFVCLEANAEVVSKTPSCYRRLLMQPHRFAFIEYNEIKFPNYAL